MAAQKVKGPREKVPTEMECFPGDSDDNAQEVHFSDLPESPHHSDEDDVEDEDDRDDDRDEDEYDRDDERADVEDEDDRDQRADAGFETFEFEEPGSGVKVRRD